MTIILLILLFITGIVTAAEVNDFKINEGFQKQSDNLAVKDDFELTVNEFTEDNYNQLFKNDTGYTVNTQNNISNITDNEFNTVGCLEIIEYNNEKIIIGFDYIGTDTNKIKDCYDALIEFNKNNNLKPIIME